MLKNLTDQEVWKFMKEISKWIKNTDRKGIDPN
jgi:hypothetical protein